MLSRMLGGWNVAFFDRALLVCLTVVQCTKRLLSYMYVRPPTCLAGFCSAWCLKFTFKYMRRNRQVLPRPMGVRLPAWLSVLDSFTDTRLTWFQCFGQLVLKGAKSFPGRPKLSKSHLRRDQMRNEPTGKMLPSRETSGSGSCMPTTQTANEL